MIDIRLLNSDAQLNNFKEIGSVAYVPGTDVTIVIRLILSQLNIRYIPPVAAVVSLVFQNRDDTELTKVATLVDADDRSIWKVELTQAESEQLIGQNFVVLVDEDPILRKGVAANSLERVILDGEC